MKIKILALLSVFLLTATACEFGAPGATATPTVNAAATQQARDAIATQAAEQTLAAEETAAMLLTETVLAGQTATADIQNTERANVKMTAQAKLTATVIQATVIAEPMSLLVEDLYSQGYLHSAAGHFLAMDDWEASEAQINYFFRYRQDVTVSDFVYRAYWEWDSASASSNWFNAGCGVVFRETPNGNFYYISLRLDGNVRGLGYVDGVRRDFGRQYATRLDVPAGAADVMLVADGNVFRFWVNGVLSYTHQDNAHTEGTLGFSVSSGTNAGFGTRCIMTEIELWLLD